MMRQLLLVMICIFLVGCGPVKLPKISTYALTSLKNVKVPRHSRTKLTLAIAMPSANPGFQSSNMIYMITPFQLSVFTRNRWVAPPAQMLAPIVVQAIRAKGYFKAVIAAPIVGKTNFRLDLQLLKLQQEFLLPQSQVCMQVEATLFNNQTNQVVSTQTFSALVPANMNNPYCGVLAANEAVTSISNRIANWCQRQTHLAMTSHDKN